MAEIWRLGADRNLERAVIGRRTSENEVDLLLLLEDDAPEAERERIDLPTVAPPRRAGEPSAVELLEAIREWVDTGVKAKSAGREKFMAAVAMNALGMLIREAENPIDPHDAALSAELMAGKASLATPGVLPKLRATMLAKLANDSPKYASLAAAKARWLKG